VLHLEDGSVGDGGGIKLRSSNFRKKEKRVGKALQVNESEALQSSLVDKRR
jgi:hypothetical protein